jgi:hypothetical protein
MRIHGTVLLESRGRLHWNASVPADKRVMPKEFENLKNRYDARVEGRIVYDRAHAKIVRWDMAAIGDYSGVWIGYRQSDGLRISAVEPVPYGFAFEIDQTAYDVPAARRRAKPFLLQYTFKQTERHYWDPDLWQEDAKRRPQR